MYSVIVRQGDKYGIEYTTALVNQLRHMTNTIPLILGDGEDANIPLRHGLKGWWAKMELFSPELKKYRPLFYVDLDSLIHEYFKVKPVTVLTVCREWISRDPHDTRIQSSVMSIPKDTDEIWDRFLSEQDQASLHPGGDQWYLQRFTHAFFDEDFVGSYKVHGMTHKITTFHGKPKMCDVEEANKIWQSYMT